MIEVSSVAVVRPRGLMSPAKLVEYYSVACCNVSRGGTATGSSQVEVAAEQQRPTTHLTEVDRPRLVATQRRLSIIAGCDGRLDPTKTQWASREPRHTGAIRGRDGSSESGMTGVEMKTLTLKRKWTKFVGFQPHWAAIAAAHKRARRERMARHQARVWTQGLIAWYTEG